MAQPVFRRKSFEDFNVEAARGNVGGARVIHKFGRNDAVGNAFEPIAFGGVYQTPYSAAVSLEIISSSDSDALDSTGAHEYTLIGLDASYAEQEVTVAAPATLGSSNAASVSGTWFRLYRAYVSTSGSYALMPGSPTGSHVGTITIRVASAGATWATIDATTYPRGQTEISCYTVPTGKTAFIRSLAVTADPAQSTNPTVVLFQRPNVDDVSSTFTGTMRTVWSAVAVQEAVQVSPYSPWGPFVGPCDLGMMALGAVTTATVEADFEILEYDT